MIVITGPGRSGTSIVTRIYVELGFDPGGRWVDDINGGLEALDIVELNDAVIDGLGVSYLGAPGGRMQRVRRAGKKLVPARARDPLSRVVHKTPMGSLSAPGLVQWDRMDAVVQRLGPRLREMAADRSIAKDPRFLWTLPAWVASGAAIEHVTFCIRTLDEAISSRLDANHLRFRSRSAAKNSFAYGVGLGLTTAVDARLSYAFARFPDFVTDPAALYAALRFPAPVSERDFRAAFGRVVRPDLVHHSAVPAASDGVAGDPGGMPTPPHSTGTAS
jgi:hypothetical protein